MKKMLLITFGAFVLLGFNKNIFAQGIYKWVDEKGTVHFSDNPTSSVFDLGKEPPQRKWIRGVEKIGRGQWTRGGIRRKEHKNWVFTRLGWQQ